jgi:hypothetical protein
VDRLRILTWHVHGSYLAALAHLDHEIVLPVRDDGAAGWGGLGTGRHWPANIREVPVADVPDLDLDVVLLQSRQNLLDDQDGVLGHRHRAVPRIYLEHDPPREHPTDTRHPVDDPNVLLVHVTHFNRLMWDAGRTPTTVVEHGVDLPEDVTWTGALARGICAINDLGTRGRRLGADVFLEAREAVPIDLVGMASESLGGLGAISPDELPAFEARYRFYFSPVRYTSLPLAVVEAMHLGMPVVALATTEIPLVLEDGVTGFSHADPSRLVDGMRELLADRALATRMGSAARERARERFGIDRFVQDWDRILRQVTGRPVATRARAAVASTGSAP